MYQTTDVSTYIIYAGCLLVICGLIFKLTSSLQLPGDILIERKNFIFYLPLASCVIMSVVISFIIHFFFRIFHK